MNQSQLKLETPDAVEAVYYEAFQHCDADKMAQLWSREHAICVHPGSGPTIGYEIVVRSWNNIFEYSNMPQVTVTVLNRITTDDLAVHVVTEQIGEGPHAVTVLATNIYQKFNDSWLIVEHHASIVEVEHKGHTLQ